MKKEKEKKRKKVWILRKKTESQNESEILDERDSILFFLKHQFHWQKTSLTAEYSNLEVWK